MLLEVFQMNDVVFSNLIGAGKCTVNFRLLVSVLLAVAPLPTYFNIQDMIFIVDNVPLSFLDMGLFSFIPPPKNAVFESSTYR